LGCQQFYTSDVEIDFKNTITGSLFLPDSIIFPHLRYKLPFSISSKFDKKFCRHIIESIRRRRNRKVSINIPIFRDVNTKQPFVEYFNDEHDETSMADHIYMDSSCFGLSCCCLQVTFQASNLNEAKLLYDQLASLCPIALALTAASPIFRGYLSDQDCRWNVISASMDDRTEDELGIAPLHKKTFRSRHGSIDSYISDYGRQYNDISLVYNEEYYDQMLNAGVDDLVAKHVAHLFTRDPLLIFKDTMREGFENNMHHFEAIIINIQNINSSVWKSMRLKPPSTNLEIGWRVEFRTMDVQFTEFENAAFAVFIMLLTRIILTYNLNFLMPISKVDENMQYAQKRDAIKQSKFWFRKDIIAESNQLEPVCFCQTDHFKVGNKASDAIILMSMDEIINGNKDKFPGLVPLIRKYLMDIETDLETKFVAHHKEYQKDSVVNETINFDLLKTVNSIAKGEIICEDLFDSHFTETSFYA
ncbi:glutamate--cysteine ligase catalytic subunit-like protein, partial [Leptotrombidium deliense]